MVYLSHKKYTQEKNIFLYPNNNEANRNAAINNDTIQLNADAKRFVPEGMFVCLVGDTARYLPRATVSTATATNAATVVCSPSQIFKAADVLYVVEPYASVAIGGTVAVADVVTITIDGYALAVTATTTVLADLVTLVKNSINADNVLNQKVFALTAGTSVYIFAKDGVSTYTIAVAETSDAVTIAIGGSATRLGFGTALGTVSSVSVATNTVTLTGNAAAVVPVGTHIGVRTVSQILGVDAHQRDYTDAETQTIGVYDISSGVRENFLPYIDGDIKRRLPRITFITKA
jgi:hypothetical protein